MTRNIIIKTSSPPELCREVCSNAAAPQSHTQVMAVLVVTVAQTPFETSSRRRQHNKASLTCSGCAEE